MYYQLLYHLFSAQKMWNKIYLQSYNSRISNCSVYQCDGKKWDFKIEMKWYLNLLFHPLLWFMFGYLFTLISNVLQFSFLHPFVLLWVSKTQMKLFITISWKDVFNILPNERKKLIGALTREMTLLKNLVNYVQLSC